MTPTPPQVPVSTHSTPTGTCGAARPTPPHTPVAVPPVSSLNVIPPLNNQTTTQCKWQQYDSFSDSEKEKVEAVLFLMDKFAVGDPFVHEWSMLVYGMPRSYLIKQCRDNLDSSCTLKSTSGPEPGAQISFKDSLNSKLNSLVSISFALKWYLFLFLSWNKCRMILNFKHSLHWQAEKGELSTDRRVRVKISGTMQCEWQDWPTLSESVPASLMMMMIICSLPEERNFVSGLHPLGSTRQLKGTLTTVFSVWDPHHISLSLS